MGGSWIIINIYLGVGEGHDDERDDKLHDGRDGSVDLTVVIRRPVDQFMYDQYKSLIQGDCYLYQLSSQYVTFEMIRMSTKMP